MQDLTSLAHELGLRPESYHAKSTALCAIVTHNMDAWFDPAEPAGRIRVIGFCTMAGQPLVMTAQCQAVLKKTLKNCGEFADQIGNKGPDFIQISENWQTKTTLIA